MAETPRPPLNDTPALKAPPAETTWRFYNRSGDAWTAMLDACEAATETIDFEQYIFRARHIGRRFLTLFEEKAKQGVRIRLLCDALGSLGLYFSPMKRRLKKQGVELVFYNPPRPWKLWCVCGLFPRDHRKIAVIDRKIAFTGGVCIDQSMRDWRDTHVQLEGEVVSEIQHNFDGIWESARSGECRATFDAYPREVGENTLYLNDPSCGKPVLREKILSRLREARSRVMIATPYFVPAKSFTKIVCDLVDRGVDVSIMTSAYSNPVSYILGRYYAGRFLKSGARYFIYERNMLHAKTLLIDADFVAIGSFNVDNLSFYRNQEADVISHDPAVVAELQREFERDIRDCREFTYAQWKRRSLFERFVTTVTRPLHGIL